MTFPEYLAARPAPAETCNAVRVEFERWLADPSEDKDVRPLARAAATHLKSGRVGTSELAPCLAVLYFSVVEFEHGWLITASLKGFTWLLRSWIYRGRPMWNDFYMCLWQLSRETEYVARLYWHLKRGNVMQQNTGAWMVNSVCQQDAAFDACWSAMVGVEGPCFGGPISI